LDCINIQRIKEKLKTEYLLYSDNRIDATVTLFFLAGTPRMENFNEKNQAS